MMFKNASTIILSLVIGTFLIGASLLAISNNESSETGIAISGMVVDAISGEGIPDAEVIIEDLNESSKTDEYGSFHFLEIEPGEYTLTVQAEGFEEVEEKVDVNEEGATVEIQLEPEEL